MSTENSNKMNDNFGALIDDILREGVEESCTVDGRIRTCNVYLNPTDLKVEAIAEQQLGDKVLVTMHEGEWHHLEAISATWSKSQHAVISENVRLYTLPLSLNQQVIMALSRIKIKNSVFSFRHPKEDTCGRPWRSAYLAQIEIKKLPLRLWTPEAMKLIVKGFGILRFCDSANFIRDYLSGFTCCVQVEDPRKIPLSYRLYTPTQVHDLDITIEKLIKMGDEDYVEFMHEVEPMEDQPAPDDEGSVV